MDVRWPFCWNTRNATAAKPAMTIHGAYFCQFAFISPLSFTIAAAE